jgi:hypothetical protein
MEILPGLERIVKKKNAFYMSQMDGRDKSLLYPLVWR